MCSWFPWAGLCPGSGYGAPGDGLAGTNPSVWCLTPSIFFYSLDGVQAWNRIYGSAGFLQYQFLVLDPAAQLLTRTLEALRQVGAPSFLTVLKRFGLSNSAPLSFPLPGWALASDLPAAVPGLLEVLDQLDQEVAAVGGRLYLAKDSPQSASMLQRSCPWLPEWQKTQQMLDPRGVLALILPSVQACWEVAHNDSSTLLLQKCSSDDLS